MPTLPIKDTELYYEDNGRDDEAVVFSHSLLFDLRQYEFQREALGENYWCIAYDHRGHGKSRPAEAPMVDMETLYLDAVELIERFDVGPCHFVGTSMGGFVGLRLAARRPDLVESLVLAGTRAGVEPSQNIPKYERLVTVAKWLGIDVVLDRVLPLMFSDQFLEDPSVRAERETWRERLAANDDSIFKAVLGVLHRPAVESELDRIEAPTLVIHGEEDRAVAVEEGEKLAEAIDGARLEVLPQTGHLSSIERPQAFAELLGSFFADV